MSTVRTAARTDTVARTIRFPARLRRRLTDDAARCGRSFEAQVIAILRHHYGEDVDIAPAPEDILALARASFAGMTVTEQRHVTRRLKERKCGARWVAGAGLHLTDTSPTDPSKLHEGSATCARM